MKLIDLCSLAKNKINQQENLSFKKKKLKEVGLTTNDLLQMNIDKIIKGNIKW